MSRISEAASAASRDLSASSANQVTPDSPEGKDVQLGPKNADEIPLGRATANRGLVFDDALQSGHIETLQDMLKGISVSDDRNLHQDFMEAWNAAD